MFLSEATNSNLQRHVNFDNISDVFDTVRLLSTATPNCVRTFFTSISPHSEPTYFYAAQGSIFTKKEFAEKAASLPIIGVVTVVTADVICQPIKRIDKNTMRYARLLNWVGSLEKLRPITVRWTDGNRLRILDGVRRYNAYCDLGIKKIPVFIAS